MKTNDHTKSSSEIELLTEKGQICPNCTHELIATNLGNACPNEGEFFNKKRQLIPKVRWSLPFAVTHGNGELSVNFKGGLEELANILNTKLVNARFKLTREEEVGTVVFRVKTAILANYTILRCYQVGSRLTIQFQHQAKGGFLRFFLFMMFIVPGLVVGMVAGAELKRNNLQLDCLVLSSLDELRGLVRSGHKLKSLKKDERSQTPYPETFESTEYKHVFRAWIVWSFIPGLHWLSWLHAAIRARHRLYFVFSAVYSLPIFLLLVFTKGNEPPDWPAGLFILSWLACIIHALIKKKEVKSRIVKRELSKIQSLNLARKQTKKSE